MGQVTVAEYVALFLEAKGVPAAFQLSGGMIAFLTDSIHSLGATPLIHNRHEQASGFAAEGATRVTGNPSVAMGTSGPGATNLITPIASCFYDSVPVVFITGQVRTDEIKKSKDQRQNGFQELDICEVVAPITKKTWRITSANQIPNVLEQAWEVATSDRPGPVLIDLPIDIQQQGLDDDLLSSSKIPEEVVRDLEKEVIAQIKHVACSLKDAKNPLVLIGGGIRTANATKKLQEFLETSNIPYVSTLMGLDAASHQSNNYIGFIGSYGNRWANEALIKSDVLLVLGSRLDVRQTGPNIDEFKKNKTIIRVDIDQNEINGRIKSQISINADLNNFLDAINGFGIHVENSQLLKDSKVSKSRQPQNSEQIGELPLNPNDVMFQIAKTFKSSNGFIVDVGQHQMWAAQSICIEDGQRFLTSGGLGAMGFALPAAIGASFSQRGKWVVIIGDGCLQLSLQELQTVSQYQLPISICVINNEQHGMVAQFQEENMNSRYIGTREGFSNPDFKRVAFAFGIRNYSLIENLEDLGNLTESISKFETGPSIIEFKINRKAKALPKMQVKKN